MAPRVDGAPAVEVPPVSPSPVPPASGPGHDRLLDVVRSVAIVRVVLWHTWSWWWLTWIPAMPAMFFTTGALLERSLVRRGWARTVAQRARRLLLPYWTFSAAACSVMVLGGWRPGPAELWPWVLPLQDPVGSVALPGLWVPLWYLRAYLWFVLGSGLLRVVAARLGAWSVALAAGVGAGMWWWSLSGREVPLAWGDAAAYTPFVLAGMVYASGHRVPRRPGLLVGAIGCGIAAWRTWHRFGPADGVVNRSYLLTMLVGACGLLALVACRASVVAATSAAAPLIAWLNSRALTIYLWQGFGLVAAEHLVDQRLAPGPWRAAASLAVVTAVIAAAVAAVGRVEDLAGGRASADRRHGGTILADRTRSRVWRRARDGGGFVATRRAARRVAVVAPGTVLVVVALVLPLPTEAVPEAPLSGAAVVARAGMVQESLASDDGLPEPVTIGNISPAAALAAWVDANGDAIERVGLTQLHVSVTWPDGRTELLSWSLADGLGDSSATGDGPASGADELMPWWSMTKTVTAAWFVQLAERGVVQLDDPLATYVPEVPHASEITLEQLARHTSGVPSESDSVFYEADPARDLERWARGGVLSFEPGSGFAYSRNGYFLLALALERASGTTWRAAVEDMAAAADVEVHFDEDDQAADHVTDPDGHGYRGALWASGALVTTPSAGTKLLHWLFTDGLSSRAVDRMASFSADPERWYYGLGLTPLCPCSTRGDRLRADRFGIDAAVGSFAVDRPSGAVLILRPDSWWEDLSPAPEFYELESALLDSLANG